MKISARNRLKGKIVEVRKGTTTAHVRIDIGGQIVTSAITNEAVDELKLASGQSVYAVIKASDVMVGIDEVCLDARKPPFRRCRPVGRAACAGSRTRGFDHSR